MAQKKQEDGWIKINRKLMYDSKIWLSEPFSKGQAWIDLLLLAQWRNRGKFKAGTVYVSQLYLADRWHWSRGRVRRFLKELEDDTTICTSSSTTGGTTILIENWGKYQLACATNDTTNDTTKRTYHKKDIEEPKKIEASSSANADSASWKTADERVPIEYRADFESFEQYDRWRNR